MTSKNFIKLGIVGVALSLSAIVTPANATVSIPSSHSVITSPTHNHQQKNIQDTPEVIKKKEELSNKLLIGIEVLLGMGVMCGVALVALNSKKEQSNIQDEKFDIKNKIQNIRKEYIQTNENKNIIKL